MIVVLTEKPSVAREISVVLGAKQKMQGYFEGNGYQVTWAFGHLVTLNEPQDYTSEWSRWTLQNLPMIPSRFQLKSRDDKGSKEQLRVIAKLLKNGSQIISATDAGREGELIFRNILQVLKLDHKPFLRLWLSSLTEEAIKEAFSRLQPGSNYDNLYDAASCRSEADWIIGLNGTRNLTVRYGRGRLWSMGRVQTPVLAMLADRDDEITTFQSEVFFELYTTYKEVLFKSVDARFKEKKDAEEVFKHLQGFPFHVISTEKKREKTDPPLLFDLTELQREMNKRYGISAANTLNAAQALYEAKIITYPRTDSQYLTTDLGVRLPSLLKSLQKSWEKEIAPLNLESLPLSKRIVDDKKVSDHHAIIPTGRIPGFLPPDQKRVFDAVVLRFIAAFYPPCEKDVTVVEGNVQKVIFRVRGVTPITLGWTALYQSEEVERPLPPFVKGESGPHQLEVKEGKTTPPKHFTESSLLGAMAMAGKQVEDEELKAALKERGIGTPATRAAIIETLIERQYIKRVKKNLEITPLGRYLVALIQDPLLKSVEMTGNWECQLRRMEKGAIKKEQFMHEIVVLVKDLLNGSDIFRVDPSVLGSCPLCGHPVIKGNKGYGCSNWKKGCPFVLWINYKGIQFDQLQVQYLLQRKILPTPLTIVGEKMILALTKKGLLIEIPFPSQVVRKVGKRLGTGKK